MKEIKKVLHESKGKVWFAINIFFTIIYLIWRSFFTIPFEYGIVSIIGGVSLLIVEALGMVEAFVHYANMYSVENYPLPTVPMDEMPDVDVFIATYSETPELLHKTINGCKYMDYPDKNKVHIYLCDDNRRPEMKALALEMGVHYLERENNEGAKAGNLNHAMACSHSPYIVTFDADMIPKHDFLMKTVPYFVDAENRNRGKKPEDQIKLGFLQTPQAFYNPDMFQFNLFSEGRIPNEQDYFYKDIQVARTKTNSVIYGGSNTVLSREALDAVGGFYTEAITEDFATGILIEKKGYVSIAIGEVLASGLSANDLQGLIQQRIRWARGVIATGRKMHIYSSNELSFAQKMNYWASIWYWYAPLKRLIYIMSPVLYATFGFMVFKCTLPQILIFWLPMYVSSNISLRMLSGNIRNTKWTGVYETIMFPFMLVPIILETFGITLKKFKVTDKDEQKNEKGKNLIYCIPFAILILLSVIGLINCIFVMFDSGSFGPIVVMFWLMNNIYFLDMAILFVDGRFAYRKSERVETEIQCTLRDEIQTLRANTRDISETGIAVSLRQPWYIEPNEEVAIHIEWQNYVANLIAELVYVTNRDDEWNYSFDIKSYEDTYDEYIQIVHDRVPDLPASIKKHSGIFDDLKINTTKRVEQPFFEKRKYARLVLNVNVYCEELHKDIRMVDFDYVDTCLEGAFEQTNLTLKLEDDLFLTCSKSGHTTYSGGVLYTITNLAEFVHDEQKYHRLVEWIDTKYTTESNSEKQKKVEEIQNRKKNKPKDFNESDIV